MYSTTASKTTAESAITAVGKYKVPLIIGGIILVAIVFLYNSWSSTWTEGIRYETTLNAQYLDNQNYLSTYISSFREQTGLAQASTVALNTVLEDAVKGRYESTSAGGGGYTVNSPFFNAIAEAYPELSTAELVRNWGKIQDYVVSGRESYRNQQSKLLDQLRSYDTWRQSGVIKRLFIGILGFPSDNLKARIGTNVISGTAALDKMYQIVLTSDTIDAYNDGIMEPLAP